MTAYRLPGPCLVLAPGGQQSSLSGHCACGTITAFIELAAATPVGQHRDCNGLAYPDGGSWHCSDCGQGIPQTMVDVIAPDAAQLAWHCYVAACDCGRCGDLLMGRDGEDDSCAAHAATPADLAGFARDFGWRITTGLGAYCPDSALPAGAVLLSPPVPGALSQITASGEAIS